MKIAMLPTREEKDQGSAPLIDERGIPRHARDGRPKIFRRCATCDGGGRVPSEKRAGSTVQCKKCKGEGWVGEYYSRTTTFIDVLDDKSNLAKWQQRMVAQGLLATPWLMDKVRALKDPNGADKSELDMLCEKAREIAGAEDKANIGTGVHELTEDIDNGIEPVFIPEEFVKDLQAYAEATKDFQVVGVEQFCVLDQYKAAGTFDRLVIHEGKLKIADVKTGRIDFGWGKIAMQLAAYSRMVEYNPLTYDRKPLTYNGLEVDLDEAIVIHLPAGEGRCELLGIDIAKGWEALALAQEVRDHRKFWSSKASQGRQIALAVA